jgi:hypothetical protein
MLAANYFLKLKNKPHNSTYKLIKRMKNFSGAWQTRSIPTPKTLEKFKPNLFVLPQINSPTTNPIPPWKL